MYLRVFIISQFRQWDPCGMILRMHEELKSAVIHVMHVKKGFQVTIPIRLREPRAF